MSLLKGTIVGGNAKYVNYYLEYTLNSQNIASNTSNITLHMYAQATSTSVGTYNTSGCPVKIYYTKNGVTTNVVNRNQGIDFRNKKVVDMGSWTGNIEHNSDGTLTIGIGGSFSGTGSSWVTSGTVSGNWTLTTIPRASSFTVSNPIIGETATISINRASSGFTHTLSYSFGTLSGTIASNVGSSCNWAIPTSFYNQIPTSTSGNCTITCVTYSGSTEIGRSSKVVTITCNKSDCIPTLSVTVVDVNSKTTSLTGNSSKLVRHVSTARITPKATGKNGASIAKITVGGTTISSYLDIPNINEDSFIVTAIDSRGYSNTTIIYLTSSMIDYVLLTCNAIFKRTTQTGGTVQLEYSGNYFNGSFGGTSNTLTLKWSYRVKGSSSWITGGNLSPTKSGNTYSGKITCGSNFNYQTDYEFIIYYSDKLNDLDTKAIPLYKSVSPFAICQNGILLNGVFLGVEIVDEWEE